MKQIPILEWSEFQDSKNLENFLLRLPYIDLDAMDLGLEAGFKQNNTPYGYIAPYEDTNLEFNIRSASRISDRLTSSKIYATVPRYQSYERLRTMANAGFRNIAIPLRLGPCEYDHYFQFLSSDMVKELNLHVAGGEFTSQTWSLDHWTWSKETL